MAMMTTTLKLNKPQLIRFVYSSLAASDACFLPLASFRQFLLLASPSSIPLSAYVYAVLGVPPTQTGTIMPVLLRLYTRAFNSVCILLQAMASVTCVNGLRFMPPHPPPPLPPIPLMCWLIG